MNEIGNGVKKEIRQSYFHTSLYFLYSIINHGTLVVALLLTPGGRHEGLKLILICEIVII